MLGSKPWDQTCIYISCVSKLLTDLVYRQRSSTKVDMAPDVVSKYIEHPSVHRRLLHAISGVNKCSSSSGLRSCMPNMEIPPFRSHSCKGGWWYLRLHFMPLSHNPGTPDDANYRLTVRKSQRSSSSSRPCAKGSYSVKRTLVDSEQA